MKRQTLFGLTGPLIAGLIPLALFLYLKASPHMDHVMAAPVGHFFIVSAAALLASVAAALIGVVGTRLRNLQVTLVALAYMSLAVVFAVHGLATPHFILPVTRLPGVAAQLSVLLTSFWLSISTLPSDHWMVRWLAGIRHLLVPIWSLLLIAFLTVSLLKPTAVDWIPVDKLPLRGFVAGITIGLSLMSGYLYWQSYRYSRFPLQIAIVYGAGWMAVAQVIISGGELWHASWWIYHFLFLAAVLTVLGGLVIQYRTGSSVATAIRGLFATDPHERLEAGISPSVRALVLATEAKDSNTAGHSYRVALSAMRLGEAMGLSPEQLRAIVQGGIVHDVGKMEVPDQILNKPGALTPEERLVIERHPATGYQLCRRLGFLPEELGIIRSHHERWDGAGYPDQLQGEQIPLLARIMAIADVYDALTSSRSYRSPWSHAEARDYIMRQAGTQFNPACVTVWARLTERGPLASPTETVSVAATVQL